LMQRLQQQDQVRVTALLPVDVSALCLRVALAKRGQHAVDVVAADDLVARGDTDTLETLLGHLVQNAIDASPDDAPVRIEAMQGVDGCSIRVIDQGVGMTPEFIRTTLFRPFSSTKEGGFGIGAYQARQLAEAMQANLAVESRLGSGTIFTLRLATAARQTSRESEAA
jgi:signal transduction histidine kinase